MRGRRYRWLVSGRPPAELGGFRRTAGACPSVMRLARSRSLMFIRWEAWESMWNASSLLIWPWDRRMPMASPMTCRDSIAARRCACYWEASTTTAPKEASRIASIWSSSVKAFSTVE